MRLLRLCRDALQRLLDLDAALLRLGVKLRVLLDAPLELVAALRVADVLGPDIDPLWRDVVVHAAVDEETHSAWRDVPDNARAAVVQSVRHALVDGAVHMHVDDIADPVRAEFDRWRGHPVLAVLPPEEVACAPAKTGGVAHCKKARPKPPSEIQS